MICLIALATFTVLGIFSARYRSYAREAFDCVFRRVTLRPCIAGFDRRMKGKVTARLMKRSPKLAGFVYRHFELLSWIFTALMIASLMLAINGIYNLMAYGSCDPQSGSCIITEIAAIQQANCTAA